MKRSILVFMIIALLFTGCATSNSQSSTPEPSSPSATYQPTSSVPYKGFEEDEYKNIKTFYDNPDKVISYSVPQHPYKYYSNVTRKECVNDAKFIHEAFKVAKKEYERFLTIMESVDTFYINMHIVDERLPKVGAVTFDVAVSNNDIRTELLGIFKRATLAVHPEAYKEAASEDITQVMFYSYNEIGTPIEGFKDAGNYYFGTEFTPITELQFASLDDEKRFYDLREQLVVMSINKYYSAYLESSNYPFLTK